MASLETSAAQLEAEIRARAPIAILDVRDRGAFADWRIQADDVDLVNVPLHEIEANPALAAAGLVDREVRVLCTRGRTSAAASELLRSAGIAATSVQGGMIAWSRLLTSDEVPLPSQTGVIQFRREARGCLSYLVASAGEGLVVDPAPDIEAYLAAADRRDIRIRHVLDTHLHADHLSGMRALGAATGATMHLSVGGAARGAATDGIALVRDGDLIEIGDADLRVIELPGHTSDNVGIVIDDVAVIAGDSLFADSVARPDLEVGDVGAAGAARLLHRTLHERLLGLGDGVVLLPCHYAGGRRSSPIAPTLGDVKASSDLLGLREDAFVAAVLAAMPPRPENYLEIIAANLAPSADPDIASLEVGANNCAATVTQP